MTKVFIAATRQNDGKTIVSLGLLSALKKRMKSVAYMKPVGQHFKLIDGKKIDKDAVLMQKVFDLKDDLSHMSPIAVPRGFTEKYILEGERSHLVKKVKKSFDVLAHDNDFVLLEGTGHAGVGSVFDMSNSQVASMLGAKVVLISCGGIGKPIDEIMLNHALFDAQGVEVIGVIINKVFRDKYHKINNLVRRGLKNKNIAVLGVIPFETSLSNPTVSELLDDLDGKLLCGEKGLNNVVERFIIGDVVAHEALDYVSGGTLLIAPGNREDFIYAALSGWVLGISKKYHISGIIATYGRKPSKKTMEVIARTNIPLILVKGDSFTTARKINSTIFKLRAEDKLKIERTESLIEEYVDVDRILELVSKPPVS